MTVKVPNCPKCHVPMELVRKVPGTMERSPLYTFRCQNCQLLFTQEQRDDISHEEARWFRSK
jgi:transposase-like protein